MQNKMRKIQLIAVSIVLTWSGAVSAQSAEETDELIQAYGDQTVISIATGSQQPLSRAPAVASVIMAADFKAMGATDLDQVLESVPGLHVSMFSAPLNPIYSFRGIHTGYNAQVLMLVNGQAITSVFTGNRGQAWGGMPLDNVARIEIIRGPGSALYGADAFSGVINIITKTAADIKGVEYGVRAGSFNSRDAWIQSGHNWGELQAAFYLRAGHTDGQHGMIEKDLQSTLDPLFGTHVSRAPGRINATRKALDASADLSLADWRLRAAFQKREVGIGAGLADALDPDGKAPESRLYLDLSYQKANFIPHWDVSATLGYYELKNDVGNPAYKLFPAGAFGGAYPDGVIGNPGHFERHEHASVSAFFTGLDEHRIRIGSGYRVEDMYAASEIKNFDFVVIPGFGPALLPLPGVVDATGNPALVYMLPHKRNIKYIFAQDEWKLAKDWMLTAGVRRDNYSDFGGTTNPRLALVWDAAYNFVVKAIYGQAFRAPNFVEQYTKNNPVNIGNPNLHPETIKTAELAFSWQPTPNWNAKLNLFEYRMHDIIVAIPNVDPSTGKTFQNTGDQNGRGMELEANWDASRALRFTGNISLQRSTDKSTGLDAGLAPHQRLFGRADWRLAPYWQLGTTINHVAERKRQPGDSRATIPDYTTVDFSLRREKLIDNWELRATVLNLFNADAREPTVAPGNIPFDLPLPGRGVYLELSHRF
ncbi:MAG: TonB-dependent receptor [Pseudomonadota bacterium]